MRFAKWVFLLAAITGVLMLIPPYFLEQRFGQDNPPPVNHPEFYGFLAPQHSDRPSTQISSLFSNSVIWRSALPVFRGFEYSGQTESIWGPEPTARYNLVVIGAGTAGLVTAAGAAGLGARVALVERELLGGDCLNVG
jgi:hypothetical protein